MPLDPPCLLGATPHRSRRAARPHRAPASGLTCGHPKVPALRGRARVTGMTRPCVRSLVCAATFPLASSLPPPPPPVPWATFVRRLPRYYEAVRLPAPVHHGRAPWVHRADLARMGQARYRASRVPYTVFPCMPEVSDPARSVAPSPKRGRRYCLPRVRSASAPRNSPISGLHTLPARSPVNASPTPLPAPAHDSGLVWLV